jgi:hypothetical protein
LRGDEQAWAAALVSTRPVDNPAMSSVVRWWCGAVVAVWMLGCSPALNWRASPMDGPPLSMLLPCKPDHAVRDVTLADQALTLTMQGCDAAGATFAVSHVRVPGAAQAPHVLAVWKDAVLAHVHAAPTQETAFSLSHGWDIPQSVRIQTTGQRADGTPVVLDAVWFARVDKAHVHLFHAVMFAPQAMPQAADTFFSSLTMP